MPVGVWHDKAGEAAARELVVSAWREYNLNLAVEKKILARYGSMLSNEDHQARVDKLLFPDSESSAAAALRISKLLPAADQKKVAARVAVVKRGGNAGKLLDAIPASAKEGDVGLLYNRIQWLRRKDRDQEAWQMMLDAPREPRPSDPVEVGELTRLAFEDVSFTHLTAASPAVSGVSFELRRGETVGVLMDTNMTPPQGVFVDFFGRKACTASGVARVAKRTGAAVVPAFAIWDDALGKYRLHLEAAIPTVCTGDDEADAIANTQNYTAAIERIIRAHPEQWLWVHRRWKTRPPGEPPLY